MSLDVGELRARVAIDQSAVPSGLARLRRTFTDHLRRLNTDAGGMGRTIGATLMHGVHRGMSSLAGTVTKVLKGAALGVAAVAAGGVVALGAIGVAGAVMGTKVASGNEQAKISFETMLGSATKADKFLRQLQKFAAETPFEFPELQTAASSLISAGIEAGKVIPIMRTLGDVTSGMGTGSEGVKRATIALQQMSAAGRITGEDLNQLRDAGIPVYDLLAQATGKSKAEVVKLAQAGKLGKKELGLMMEALESGKGLERFSGLMEKQSHSLAGMWSTLKDTFGQGLASIMTEAFPLMKDGLAGLSTEAGRLFTWFRRNKSSVASVFEVGGASAKAWWRIVKGVWGAFFGALTDGKHTFADFAAFMESHQTDIVQALIAMAKGSIGFGRALAVTVSVALRGLAGLTRAVNAAMVFMIGRYADAAHAAAEAWSWVPGIGPKLAGVAGKLDDMLAHVKANKDADKFDGWADSIDGKLVPALDAAEHGLEKVAGVELDKARNRERAAALARAIDSISVAADGGKVKLRRWSDVSKLGADEQAALRGRIREARGALREQIAAAEDAGAGQKKLTKTWKEGRDKLYDEFRQMGLSKTEAKKLAAQYAGVKPKVTTKFETPGLKGARDDTRDLDKRVNDLNNKNLKVKVTFSSSGKIQIQRPGRAATGPINGGGPSVSYLGGVVTGWSALRRGPIMAANGAVLPGWSPGRDVHKFFSPTGGELELSGGEAVMRPEFTRAVGGPAGVKRINLAARTGKLGSQRFAGGGVYNTVTENVAHNQPPNVRREYGLGVNDASDYAVAQARALAKKLAAAEVARQKKAIRDSLANLGGGGGHKMSGSILSIARSFHPSYIAGHRDPQGGPAYDIGSSGAKNNAIANAMRVNHARLGLRYVISQMRIASAKHGWGWGRYSPITNLGDWRHVGHVHVSYQNGTRSARSGWANVAENGPELVVNPQIRRFRGGERVYNARDTANVLGGRPPLIGGNVQFVTDGRNVRNDVGTLVFALRTIDQGGVHSR